MTIEEVIRELYEAMDSLLVELNRQPRNPPLRHLVADANTALAHAKEFLVAPSGVPR